jgi:hypothetical protein
VRERNERIAARLVMRDEAEAHQIQRLHIVDGVGQRLFDPENERKRLGAAGFFGRADA